MGDGTCASVNFRDYIGLLSGISDEFGDSATRLQKILGFDTGGEEAELCTGPIVGDGSIYLVVDRGQALFEKWLFFRSDGKVFDMATGEVTLTVSNSFARFFVAGVLGNKELEQKLSGKDELAAEGIRRSLAPTESALAPVPMPPTEGLSGEPSVMPSEGDYKNCIASDSRGCVIGTDKNLSMEFQLMENSSLAREMKSRRFFGNWPKNCRPSQPTSHIDSSTDGNHSVPIETGTETLRCDPE